MTSHLGRFHEQQFMPDMQIFRNVEQELDLTPTYRRFLFWAFFQKKRDSGCKNIRLCIPLAPMNASLSKMANRTLFLLCSMELQKFMQKTKKSGYIT